MLPTLFPGDRLLVDPRAYRNRSPALGDIVILVDPEEPARWLVKRVVGVGPGPLDSSRSAHPPSTAEVPLLPEGTVYVTGDAVGPVRDSRKFGPVAITKLVGRAYRCYAPTEHRREL